jgi:hypothetical protein
VLKLTTEFTKFCFACYGYVWDERLRANGIRQGLFHHGHFFGVVCGRIDKHKIYIIV